jgi:hypothetical protein
MERWALCPYQMAYAGMARGYFACEDKPGKAKAKCQVAARGCC